MSIPHRRTLALVGAGYWGKNLAYQSQKPCNV